MKEIPKEIPAVFDSFRAMPDSAIVAVVAISAFILVGFCLWVALQISRGGK